MGSSSQRGTERALNANGRVGPEVSSADGDLFSCPLSEAVLRGVAPT